MAPQYRVYEGPNEYVVDIPVAGSSAVPRIISAGITYTVSDNTQVLFANQIVIQAGGILLVSGTGVLTGVN